METLSGKTIHSVAVGEIAEDPGQPRRTRDTAGEAFAGLVATVRAQGILSPLILRQTKGDPPALLLVAGHRRFAAAKALRMEKVPAVILSLTDAEAREIQLVENLQRKDLTPIEEATGYQALVDLGQSLEVIAERVGKSKGHISNLRRLLRLPGFLQEAIAAGKLTAHHGRVLAVLADYPWILEAVGRRIIKGDVLADRAEDLERNLSWQIARAAPAKTRPLTPYAHWGPKNPLGRHGVLFAPAKAMPVKSLTPVLQKHAAAKGTFYHAGACTDCPHGFHVKQGDGICLDPAGACYGIRQQNAATVAKARELGAGSSRDDKRMKAARVRENQRHARRWTTWVRAVGKAQTVFRRRPARPKELYLRAVCEKMRDFQLTPARIAVIFGPDLEALKVKPGVLKDQAYELLKRLPERRLQERLRMIYAVEDAGIREWRRKGWPFKPPVAGLVGWGG